ncbi:MAG: leucine-rich repeat domain-containing protein [Prevotella sp.]|nr:leucine-rich repeat domain-containing protein [Candidatus Equicola stercoris]
MIKKKLLLGLFFTLVSCFCSYAQKFFVAEGLNFEVLQDSCVKVVSFPNYKYIGNIVVPESVTYEGVKYRVTTVGQRAFASCSSLLSVQLPQSVTVIQTAAFQFCPNLGNVVFPKKLEEIGDFAFQNCTKITSVTIPNSTKAIGGCCFDHCSALSNVTIGSGLKKIKRGTFSYCQKLRNISIPATIESIEDAAFSNSQLSTIVFVGKNTKYTDYAFSSTPYFAAHSQRSKSMRGTFEKRTGRKIRGTVTY